MASAAACLQLEACRLAIRANGESAWRRRNVRAEREAAAGEPGERHADEAADESAMKSVARVLGFARAALDPACAAAFFIGRGQVFLREGLAGAQQLEHRFAQLHAGGPGLVHAGAGEHVGRAGALADAREAVAGEERLAVLARLFERLRAPGAQRAVLQVAPQSGCWM